MTMANKPKPRYINGVLMDDRCYGLWEVGSPRRVAPTREARPVHFDCYPLRKMEKELAIFEQEYFGKPLN